MPLPLKSWRAAPPLAFAGAPLRKEAGLLSPFSPTGAIVSLLWQPALVGAGMAGCAESSCNGLKAAL